MLLASIERVGGIRDSVANTSDNLIDTNAMYGQYDEKLKKSQMYLVELRKKEAANARKIKMAFWFLVFVVGYVLIRRILFPGIYRWSWFFLLFGPRRMLFFMIFNMIILNNRHVIH